jgi:hypothetical protein
VCQIGAVVGGNSKVLAIITNKMAKTLNSQNERVLSEPMIAEMTKMRRWDKMEQVASHFVQGQQMEMRAVM